MTSSQTNGQEEWWEVKPRYSAKVLIGNWQEERQEFIKRVGNFGSSIYTTDYICFSDHRPDRILQKSMIEKYWGLPKQHFFTHHEEPRNWNLVSEYDDKYNRHGFNPALPPLRVWNGRKFAWLPEKSDFPNLEPPTNYGLFEYLKKKWHKKEAEVMKSVYTIDYECPPLSAFVTRCLGQPPKSHFSLFKQGHRLQTVDSILDYPELQKYL